MTAARSRGRALARMVVVATASAALLVGCGDEGGDTAAEPTEPSSPSSTTSEPTKSEDPEPREPACSSTWVDGEQLPERYRGCFDEDKDRWVEPMVYRCSSGQQLVTFRRNFYAAKGEVINETATPLARDKDFKKAMAACGA